MGRAKSFDPELLFAAMADTTRLRLLNLLRDGEVCVCFFAGALGTNNPKISRHLAYLKKAGLVAGRRDGKWMHYSLKPLENPAASEVFVATMKMLEHDPQMVLDRKKLADFSCSASAPMQIQGRAKKPYVM